MLLKYKNFEWMSWNIYKYDIQTFCTGASICYYIHSRVTWSISCHHGVVLSSPSPGQFKAHLMVGAELLLICLVWIGRQHTSGVRPTYFPEAHLLLDMTGMQMKYDQAILYLADSPPRILQHPRKSPDSGSHPIVPGYIPVLSPITRVPRHSP